MNLFKNLEGIFKFGNIPFKITKFGTWVRLNYSILVNHFALSHIIVFLLSRFCFFIFKDF